MILKLAWKNIWRSKLRSTVVIVAIILGMFAGTFIMGFYNGMLNQRIHTVIKDEISHIQIHHPTFEEVDVEKLQFNLKDEDQLIKKIKRESKVKAYSSRRIISDAIFKSTAGTGAINLLAIDPQNEDAVTGLKSKLVEGSYFEKLPRKRIGVIISKRQADKYKLHLKSKPNITFTDINKNIHELGLKVIGIYKSQNGMLDERVIFAHKDQIEGIPGCENAHEIALLLNDNLAVDSVQSSLQSQFPKYAIKNWIEISPNMKVMLDSMDTNLYVIVIIIMLALIFGIVNTMLMAVLERTKEFGMLMAIGMNKFKVFGLVVFETIYLALIGGPTGILFGYLIITYTGNVGIPLGAFGEGMAEMGFASTVYPTLEMEKYINIGSMIIFFTLLASIYPAIKALRLNALNAIRKI